MTTSSCHAMLVKSRGIPCRCPGKHLNERDGHYYCGRHIKKMKEKEFKSIDAFVVADCPVCLEPLISGLWRTICNHRLHTKCYFRLKDEGVVTCPVCDKCILSESQDDPIAKAFKKDTMRYAGFQLWCIQKQLGKKLITSPERNIDFCTHAQRSLSLHREMKRFQGLSQEVLFDKLMTLWRDFPGVLNR